MSLHPKLLLFFFLKNNSWPQFTFASAYLLYLFSVFIAGYTPQKWTPTVLMWHYEGTVLCTVKAATYHFIIHIHWTHNQTAVQWHRESAYRFISLAVWNTPLWYKEITYGNLVGDSIVSYGPQRMHEQCLFPVLNWLEYLKFLCTSFHHCDRVPIFKWIRQTSICWSWNLSG